jgi:phospholipid transport system substrate-binding protein
MKKRNLIALVLIYLHSVCLEAETIAPLVKVESTVNIVIKLLKEINPEMTEEIRAKKLLEVRTAIESSFSFEQVARRSLGRNWKKFTEDELSNFMDLFSELLLKSYLKNFSGIGEAGITFEQERKLSEKKVEIHSKVTIENTQLPVVYRMTLVENEWQVYDAIIEGVSLVANYRSQFDSILRRGNPQKLIEILDKKVNQSE